MTIAIGFKVDDGVLLCADTQYMSNSKVYDPKVFTLPAEAPRGASFAFALAGHEENARMAIEDCIQAIRECPENKRTLTQIKTLLRRAIRGIWDAYVRTSSDPQNDDSTRFELIIGAWLPLSGGLLLFRSSTGGLVSGDKYCCVGTGAYLAEYVMRPLFIERLSLYDVVIMATHTLASTKNYDANCGGYSLFARILPDGSVSRVGEYEVQNLEAFINRYEPLMGGMFLAAANQQLSEEVFERYVAVFTTAIKDLRKSWLSGDNPLQQLTLLEKLAYAMKPLDRTMGNT